MLEQRTSTVAETPHVFHALDALRGVAAISVVLFHYGEQLHYDMLPHAYLAVDFFFVLSGFVIAHAYQAKLRRTLGFKTFLKRRVIRLWPLYFVGLTLSLWSFGADMFLGVPHQSRAIEAGAYCLGLAFLPTPAFMSPDARNLFPTNGPAWSLSLEIGINAIYAAVCKHITIPRLVGALILSLCGLVFAVAGRDDVNLGWNWENYAGGWARVFFSFFAGVALYRVHRVRGLPSFSGWAFSLLALLLLDAFSYGQPSLAFDLFCVVVLFPAVVLLGAQVKLANAAVAWASLLGTISYALYIVHRPIGNVLDWVYTRRGVSVFEKSYWPNLLAWTAIAIIAAWVLDLVDIRVRRFLSRKFLR